MSPAPDGDVRAAAPAAAEEPAALRTERSAPRSRSPASSARLPAPAATPPRPVRSPGCAGSGTTLVASAGSCPALRSAGAWMTLLSSARAPASSSRLAGSLVSSPWMTSARGPALRGSSSGSVITAVRVAMAEPLSYGGVPSTAAYSRPPSDHRSAAGPGL